MYPLSGCRPLFLWKHQDQDFLRPKGFISSQVYLLTEEHHLSSDTSETQTRQRKFDVSWEEQTSESLPSAEDSPRPPRVLVSPRLSPRSTGQRWGFFFESYSDCAGKTSTTSGLKIVKNLIKPIVHINHFLSGREEAWQQWVLTLTQPQNNGSHTLHNSSTGSQVSYFLLFHPSAGWNCFWKA